VFAKSDMIHLQQKGTPSAEIALGLCQAMVRTFLSTVVRGRGLDPPIVLSSGGAANPGLIRAFAEELQLDKARLLVAPEPLYLGALGAALLITEASDLTLAELTSGVRDLHHTTATTDMRLASLSVIDSEDPARPAEEYSPTKDSAGVFLGVDIGSVSTNLVLLDEDHRVLQGEYLPTRGEPVAVLPNCLRHAHNDSIRQKTLAVMAKYEQTFEAMTTVQKVHTPLAKSCASRPVATCPNRRQGVPPTACRPNSAWPIRFGTGTSWNRGNPVGIA
jgi:activator of 2-hydroxyglutaryl-CoA dehydratase